MSKMITYIVFLTCALLTTQAFAAGEIMIGSNEPRELHGQMVLLEGGGQTRTAIIENLNTYMGGVMFFPRAWLLDARVFESFTDNSRLPVQAVPVQNISVFLSEPIALPERLSEPGNAIKVTPMTSGDYAKKNVRIARKEIVGYAVTTPSEKTGGVVVEYRLAYVVQFSASDMVELVSTDDGGLAQQVAFDKPLKVFHLPVKSLFLQVQRDSGYHLQGLQPDYTNQRTLKINGVEGPRTLAKIFRQIGSNEAFVLYRNGSESKFATTPLSAVAPMTMEFSHNTEPNSLCPLILGHSLVY